MTYEEVFRKAVPQNKKDEDRFALVSKNVSRPISILLTIPLLKTSIKPTTITKWSVLCLFIGFFISAFGDDLLYKIIGWLFFFVWAVLDHVDGNIARYKNECSLLGDLWDTMGGYLAMMLMYFAAGIMAYKECYIVDYFAPHHYLIFGSATAMLSIFPRLMMHKKKSSLNNNQFGKEFTDKKHFSWPKVVMMNFMAPTDGVLLFFILSILFKASYFFVAFYFVINLLFSIVALKGILKEN